MPVVLQEGRFTLLDRAECWILLFASHQLVQLWEIAVYSTAFCFVTCKMRIISIFCGRLKIVVMCAKLDFSDTPPKRHGYLFRRIHLSTRSQQQSINNPGLLSSWECPLNSFYLSSNQGSFWKPTVFSQPPLGNDNAFHKFVGTKRSLPCKPSGLCLPPSKTQHISFFCS